LARLASRTLKRICGSDTCVLIELAHVCHTIASTQLSCGNVEVHNHNFLVTLASMEDQWRVESKIKSVCSES